MAKRAQKKRPAKGRQAGKNLSYRDQMLARMGNVALMAAIDGRPATMQDFKDYGLGRAVRKLFRGDASDAAKTALLSRKADFSIERA